MGRAPRGSRPASRGRGHTRGTAMSRANIQLSEPATPAVARVNLATALDRLLEELQPWRRELLGDIHHAEQRGLPHLAADLRRLHAHVEVVWKAARAVEQRGGIIRFETYRLSTRDRAVSARTRTRPRFNGKSG